MGGWPERRGRTLSSSNDHPVPAKTAHGSHITALFY